MSSLGNDLKVSALFVIFIVSILGAVMPIMLARRFSLQELLTGGFFMTLKCISTGVVLGVSLMHLLPDAIETLESQADYPLAIAIAAFGIFFTLGVDQVALFFMNKLSDYNRPRHLEPISDNNCSFKEKGGAEQESHSHTHHDHETNELELVEKHTVKPIEISLDGSERDATMQKAPTTIEMAARKTNSDTSGDDRVNTLDQDKEIYGHSHRHLHVAHDCDVLDEKLSRKLIMKAYILEVAIATHSIIIGFDYGALDSQDELSDLKILYIAFVFHQFFEGIGLGTAISGAENHLGTTVVVSLVLCFALTFSVGILLGMFAASSADEAEVVAGCANAFAAGILLHSAMIEMLAEDFFNPIFENKALVKLSMYGGVLFGFGVLALLAVWA